MANPKEPQRLGKGMIIAAWIMFLVLLTGFFDNILDRRHNPNPSPQSHIDAQGVREVRLVRNAQGHYVASGQINGHPVVFLVDTGATQVALSEALAQRLGLKKLAGTFSRTANGTVAGWQTRLARVSLGDIEMHDLPAVILPKMRPVDQVLLGMSFLKKLELIQRDGVLTLRQLPNL